jgi:hypothetical protein
VHCKAHDLDNLYVVDTSFFPSSGAVNPALTAMANALRIGDHLLTRLGTQSAATKETNGRYERSTTQTVQPHSSAVQQAGREARRIRPLEGMSRRPALLSRSAK